MLLTSRSFAEYEAMFDLDEQVLDGRVLDCCAGASSFVAEHVARGGDGLAVDPAYAWNGAALASAARNGLGGGTQIIDQHPDTFVWDWYGTVGRREAMRREAAGAFLVDVGHNPGRYVAAALPQLPLAGQSVDVALCSHLLFTWSEQLGHQWHLAALREMLRVVRREIRVYPLVVQGTGAKVPFLDQVLGQLQGDGHDVELRRVPDEFQRGADSMLVARPASSNTDSLRPETGATARHG